MIHFYNLTNGLACLGEGTSRDSPRFMRIQSTHCEQKRWADVIYGAGPDFLWHLAHDAEIVVHDESEKPRTTRALWQGVEVIRVFAGFVWGRPCLPELTRGGHNAADYYLAQARALDDRTRRWLAYFGRDASDAARAVAIVQKCSGRHGRSPLCPRK